MNKKELLDRCARDGEERVLLARALDRLELSQNRGVPAHTPFLSPGEQAAVRDLMGVQIISYCIISYLSFVPSMISAGSSALATSFRSPDAVSVLFKFA